MSRTLTVTTRENVVDLWLRGESEEEIASRTGVALDRVRRIVRGQEEEL